MNQTWQLGDLTVSAIEETELDPSTGQWLMPELTPSDVEGDTTLFPDYATGAVLRLHSHSWAMVVDGQQILVDTGIGNGKTRGNPAWHDLDTDYLANLAAAGFRPEAVDLVVLTHLHADHVGWNTRWDGAHWIPTFPRARYVVAADEWNYWQSVDMDPSRAHMFADSVQPIREAGQLDLVDLSAADHEVAPGIALQSAPGHTPGHAVVRVEAKGARGIITGDAVHHPLQVRRTDLTTRADVDPGHTVRTRRRLLAHAADDDVTLLGTHFPSVSAGRVRRTASGFAFVPST